MLAAPWLEPIREPEEIFLVDRVQHLDHRALDDLVLQCGDAQRALPSIRLGDVPPPRWQRPVAPPVDALVQVLEFVLKPLPVLLPRHPVHSGSRLRLQPEIGLPQQINVDMVEQRGEPLFLVQFRGPPYTLQSVGHACPARCPARVGLGRVPLGPCPWLPALRRRLPASVRAVLSYYDRIRLLVVVHHRLRLDAFPMRASRLTGRWSATRSPGSRTRSVRTCQGLRPRGVVERLAMTPPAMLPSAVSTASAPRKRLSWLNGWPVRSPVNASPRPRGSSTHDSGPVWIATSSPQWTFTTYSLPVSRRLPRRALRALLTRNLGSIRRQEVGAGPRSRAWRAGRASV